MTRTSNVSLFLDTLGRTVAAAPAHAAELAMRAVEWVELVIQVRKERRELSRLDPRMLKDIGIDSGIAHREISRAWDDVPARRMP